MVSGSLHVLRLFPPLKLVAMNIAESGIKHQKSINQSLLLPVLEAGTAISQLDQLFPIGPHA
jgi:hypothetical protein